MSRQLATALVVPYSDHLGRRLRGHALWQRPERLLRQQLFRSQLPEHRQQGQPDDYSMGVIGTVAPEPSLWAMMALGAVVLSVSSNCAGGERKLKPRSFFTVPEDSRPGCHGKQASSLSVCCDRQDAGQYHSSLTQGAKSCSNDE